MSKKKLTRNQFRRLTDLLFSSGDLSQDQIRAVTCAVLGHSNVVHHCLGQLTCCRCGAIIGDSLFLHSGQSLVIFGLDNLKVAQPPTLTWDKLGWRDFENLPEPAYNAALTIKPYHCVAVEPLPESESCTDS